MVPVTLTKKSSIFLFPFFVRFILLYKAYTMPKHVFNVFRYLGFYSTKKVYFTATFYAQLHFLAFILAWNLLGVRLDRRGAEPMPKKKACFGTVLAYLCLVMGIGVSPG